MSVNIFKFIKEPTQTCSLGEISKYLETCIRSTWELVIQTHSWTPPQTLGTRDLGVRATICLKQSDGLYMISTKLTFWEFHFKCNS